MSSDDTLLLSNDTLNDMLINYQSAEDLYYAYYYYTLYYQNVCILHELRRRRLLRAIIAMLIAKTSKKRQYAGKKYWVTPFIKTRKANGAFYTTIPELLQDNILFTNYCRMTKTQFEDCHISCSKN